MDQPYYFNFPCSLNHLRQNPPLQRTAIVLQKNYSEYWETKCGKIVKGVIKCEPVPVVGGWGIGPITLPKEYCHELPPEGVTYKCYKQRITNIQLRLSLYFDNSLIPAFQQKANCLLNNQVLDQVARVFDQSIIPGAILTNAILRKAQIVAQQRYLDLIKSCGFPLSVSLIAIPSTVSDFKEVR